MTRPIRRRDWLATLGLGGAAALLTPALRSLVGGAAAQPGGLRRVLICLTHGGVSGEYRPSGTGGGFDLGPWSALEPHRSDLLVAENFYLPFDLHLHGNWWPLCGTANVAGGDLPGSVSIDRHIAMRIGAADPVSSVNLDVWLGQDGYDTLSADGPERPYPASGPIETYDRVLGGLVPGASGDDAAALARLRRRESLFDHVRDDVARVRTRLSGAERERLDQYVTSLRELEERLGRLVGSAGACAPGGRPDPAVIGADRREVHPERMDAALDVLTTLLACGLTHVATVQLSGPTMGFLGLDGEVGRHQMWHGNGTPEHHERYYAYQAQQVARIWQFLRATPEAGATMADHTTLLWLNNNGGGHHNGSYDYWTMVLDGTGTFRVGERIELPRTPVGADDLRRTLAGSESDRLPRNGREAAATSLNDLFSTLAVAAGLPPEPFGDRRIATGPVEALLG